MTIALLVLQMILFVLWIFVSGAILLGLLRGRPDDAPPLNDDVALDPVTRFLNDPATRNKRRAWLVLTVGLAVCSSLSSGFLVRL